MRNLETGGIIAISTVVFASVAIIATADYEALFLDGEAFNPLNNTLTKFIKNPSDGKKIRAWRATREGERIINVTSLDAYWQKIAEESLRERCSNLKEIFSVSSQKKAYLVDNSSCLKR